MPSVMLLGVGIFMLGMPVYMLIARRMDWGVAIGLGLMGIGCLPLGLAFQRALMLFWIGGGLMVAGTIAIAVRERIRADQPAGTGPR